jgi:phage tail sheath protein FI
VPEYLAPGVYIEETSFRSKSIEGVSTSTTAFVGVTRRGPSTGTPELITSFPDFRRIYGGTGDLQIGGNTVCNYVALAAQAYFENGGRRLYVQRVVAGDAGAASATFGGVAGTATRVQARFAGTSGNGAVSFREQRAAVSGAAIGRLPVGTVLEYIGAADAVLLAQRGASGWLNAAGAAAFAAEADIPTSGIVLSLSMSAQDADGNVQTAEGMSYSALSPRYVGHVLTANPSRRADALQNLVHLVPGVNDFTTLRERLVGAAPLAGPSGVAPTERADMVFSRTLALTGGTDGGVPTAEGYRVALATLEALDDISIVAAPGHTASGFDDGAIRTHLVTHVETRTRYRVAVLDSTADDTVGSVRELRGAIDSDHAALYHPWVVIPNPNASATDASQPRELAVPPSGFICGIYARNDTERGVWKSPANEVVQGALRFHADISHGEQEALNPLGINCLRYFPGRGHRVWGARTASSDPEWKYLSVRRYMNFLESSIERGTQWAVFEPNGPALWANVRETIDAFLYNQWRQGALLGGSPKEAYFVRCDRSTMDQNDLDNGRMVCLVGVAVVKPAEFVIFRIGQKTASARD